MSIDRRNFLKIAGGTAVAGLAITQIRGALTGSTEQTSKVHAPAKRWAMVVNLKKCREQNDCTKCIDACHKCHNVPDIGNKKDEIKWIWKEKYKNAFIEQENEFLPDEIKTKCVPLFCNHCDNPPCTSVCPTKATWKREDGIVMMDWHRCVGCRYCMAACPFGSRSFNWRDPRPFIKETTSDFPTRTRGVVEKCTFCDERIVKGQLPACVEACPSKALVFGDLDDANSEVRKLLGENLSHRRKPELGTQPEIYYLI
jgi:Fe-S-cluster-containing dehydrogenase component